MEKKLSNDGHPRTAFTDLVIWQLLGTSNVDTGSYFHSHKSYFTSFACIDYSLKPITKQHKKVIEVKYS